MHTLMQTATDRDTEDLNESLPVSRDSWPIGLEQPDSSRKTTPSTIAMSRAGAAATAADYKCGSKKPADVTSRTGITDFTRVERNGFIMLNVVVFLWGIMMALKYIMHKELRNRHPKTLCTFTTLYYVLTAMTIIGAFAFFWNRLTHVFHYIARWANGDSCMAWFTSGQSRAVCMDGSVEGGDDVSCGLKGVRSKQRYDDNDAALMSYGRCCWNHEVMHYLSQTKCQLTEEGSVGNSPKDSHGDSDSEFSDCNTHSCSTSHTSVRGMELTPSFYNFHSWEAGLSICANKPDAVTAAVTDCDVEQDRKHKILKKILQVCTQPKQISPQHFGLNIIYNRNM